MTFDPFQSPGGIAMFVVCLVSTVLFLISWCGWRQLAREHAAESKPAGTVYRNASGWVSLIGSYGNCLNVIATSSGLYVETQLPFDLFHRPLFFPWRSVSAIELKSMGILWPRTRVTVVSGWYTFRIYLPERAATEIQDRRALSADAPGGRGAV